MSRCTRFATLSLAVLLLSVPGFAADEVIDLGPEEFVQADGNDITVPGYSVPSFVDWNNDLLKDLIVGEGGGGTPGKVRVYLNVGTEADPCFTDYFYAQADGGDLVVSAQGWPMLLCGVCVPQPISVIHTSRADPSGRLTSAAACRRSSMNCRSSSAVR